MAKQNQTKKITDEEIRKLVVERLKTFPTGKRLSVGQEGTFTNKKYMTSEATTKDSELLPYLFWDMNHQKCIEE